jgi:hypothetical protein
MPVRVRCVLVLTSRPSTPHHTTLIHTQDNKKKAEGFRGKGQAQKAKAEAIQSFLCVLACGRAGRPLCLESIP